MRRIINFILYFKNKFFRKNSPEIVRSSSDYHEAKRIGILFEIQNEAQYPALHDFVSRLQKDGKDVRLLNYTDTREELTHSFSCSRFSSKDISLSGKIKSQDVQEFANSRFDYLYCVNVRHSAILDTVLMHSQAKCRIGQYFKSRRDCLDLMIDLKENRSEDKLIENMERYTKVLTRN
ncbi:MAG: hypothetical protein NW226_03080 [Microscillaceae bacterium]|nr:hypothetical protein [Microscillaceae bacterium]